ncbi:hypothetical protein AWB68_04646 [Caballeronia choica]|jgi:hypothetical protein|uniref:Lipoprotein n=1 Tax=Caballeronia choica TaxID=326476 RepID=A0A158K1B8_9BURK|nr:hypothetical protein [Caballeronia choica]SAL74765.1 hypothetical protein AWB68_04646 [Caballeronia choica]
MGKMIVVGFVMGACCVASVANAELNDRTKKLLQAQALSRPQQQTTFGGASGSSAANAPRQGQGTTSGGAGSAAPARGAGGNVPAAKP